MPLELSAAAGSVIPYGLLKSTVMQHAQVKPESYPLVIFPNMGLLGKELLWLVVLNISCFSIGNFIIPTDELICLFLSTTNQPSVFFSQNGTSLTCAEKFAGQPQAWGDSGWTCCNDHCSNEWTSRSLS